MNFHLRAVKVLPISLRLLKISVDCYLNLVYFRCLLLLFVKRDCLFLFVFYKIQHFNYLILYKQILYPNMLILQYKKPRTVRVRLEYNLCN